MNGTEGYLSKVRQVESGNNNKAVNPKGGASGRYQFVKSTWEGLGYDWKDRFDPVLQEEAMKKYTNETTKAFVNKFKKTPTDVDLYGMHFLGSGTYIKLLQSPDETPITDIVSKKAYEYNQGVMNKNGKVATVKDIKKWLEKKMGKSITSTQLEYKNTVDIQAPPETQGIIFSGQDEEPIVEEKESIKASQRLNEKSFLEELQQRYIIPETIQPVQYSQTDIQPTVIKPIEYNPIQTFQNGGQVIPLNDINGFLEVKKSDIEGKGLFTKKDIGEGNLIGLAHIDNQPTNIIGKYHNHSENPNTKSVRVENKRYLVSVKPIKKGEEITVDYKKQPELEQPSDF